MVKAYPSIRVEELTPDKGQDALNSDSPSPVEFRVFAYGSATDAPFDLDRVELQSTIKAHWIGSKEANPSDDGLQIESRRFTALLDPAGHPGQRKDEILLRDGQQVVCSHVLNWEAFAPIAASPKVTVMKPGEHEYRVVIQSRDRRLFRITRIECMLSGVTAQAANTFAACEQTVQINSERVSRLESGRGVITVFTDHPAQERVDVPLVVLE